MNDTTRFFLELLGSLAFCVTVYLGGSLAWFYFAERRDNERWLEHIKQSKANDEGFKTLDNASRYLIERVDFTSVDSDSAAIALMTSLIYEIFDSEK